MKNSFESDKFANALMPAALSHKSKSHEVIKASKSVVVQLPFPLDPQKISVSWLGRLGWFPNSL